MTRTSDRTNDTGSIIAGISVFLLIAFLVLLSCSLYVSSLTAYALRERETFLAELDGNHETH